MQVFAEEWVQQIRCRYEQQPNYRRPRIYFVATSDELRTVHDEIEQWVAGLPQADQPKVIPKLRSVRNFTQTYHELAVGNTLIRLGYQLEYEKALDKLTPDWYVWPNREIPAFIVEVFTANLSAAKERQYSQEKDLLGRLQQIAIDVALLVRLGRTKVVLDQQQNKIIAEGVRQWLTNDNPPIGAQLDLDGIVFEITRRDRGYPNVQYVASRKAFLVNKKSLRENMEDKIHKYKGLATKMGIPLVVGMVAGPRTGLSLDSFWDVLLGEESVEITFDLSTGVDIDG
jgi:hypothetical protein